jgi:hypothetical protein
MGDGRLEGQEGMRDEEGGTCIAGRLTHLQKHSASLGQIIFASRSSLQYNSSLSFCTCGMLPEPLISI